jgi:FlaA1/EpsC-like NDP-sugar epimerase
VKPQSERRPRHSARALLLVGSQMAFVLIAYLLAWLARFDLPLKPALQERFIGTIPIVLLVSFGVFLQFKPFQGVWRYVSISDVTSIVKAKTVASVLFLVISWALFGFTIPRSVVALDWLFCVMLLVGSRYLSRARYERNSSAARNGDRPNKRRAVLVGAGDGAEALIREIHRNGHLAYKIVGIVDDSTRMQRRSIHGVRIAGTIDNLPQVCQALRAEQILIAIPSATAAERARILTECRKAAVPVKTVPSLDELIEGKARVGELADVKPQDILGRQPVNIDTAALAREISGKRVLVTGAGGSIGSELCQQLASFGPELIILYERGESSLHFTQIELQTRWPEMKLIPVVGDIQDGHKLDSLMSAHCPQIVYHAAAFKHVHLMEAQPLDAIYNNIFGTEVVARAALKAGVEKFVFISTDKAVKPVGVMGKTKRVAEDLLLGLSGPTAFISVRFGNVLGSDGSVLPLFQRQIARREPITLTDPAATRYFMLVAEAAQLVLQAGAQGKGGEVFFLDMGEPIRMGELTDGLIRLCGLSPGEDVQVIEIGLRPGERLNEELFREAEELLPSEHEKILTVANRGFDPKVFSRDFERLRQLTDKQDEIGALKQLKAMTESAESDKSVIHSIDITERRVDSISLLRDALDRTDPPHTSSVSSVNGNEHIQDPSSARSSQ